MIRMSILNIEVLRVGLVVQNIILTMRSNIVASFEKDDMLFYNDAGESCFGQFACKGCDWKRNDEAGQDRSWKRKIVLNDGYPLCQMPKSDCEDPRREVKEESYYHSHSQRLDLPAWAFNSADDLNDPITMNKPEQAKSALPRGIRGFMLPVIRINACVVKDHGSFVSDSRVKVRGKERFSSRSSRPYSTSGDAKHSSEDSHCKTTHEQDSHDSSNKSALLSIPKDHLCRLDELKLHLG